MKLISKEKNRQKDLLEARKYLPKYSTDYMYNEGRIAQHEESLNNIQEHLKNIIFNIAAPQTRLLLEEEILLIDLYRDLIQDINKIINNYSRKDGDKKK